MTIKPQETNHLKTSINPHIKNIKNNQNGFNSTQQLFLPTFPSTLPTLQSFTTTTTFTLLQPSTTTFTLLQPSTTTIWITAAAATSSFFSSTPKGTSTAATSSRSSFSTATTSPSSSSPCPSSTFTLSKQPHSDNSRGCLTGWPLAPLNARFCPILLRSEEEKEEDTRNRCDSL